MLNNMKGRWLYFPVAVLFIYLLVRIIDLSKIIMYFPLEHRSDIVSYIGELHFLIKYGFHSLVPNWYNGYILFQNFPPGWAFFTAPIYYLTHNVVLSSYLSIIFILIIIFLIIYLNFKVSLIKKFAFFLFIFANPIAIGNFIRLGRAPELLGWMGFALLFFLLMRYKDKPFDKKSLLIIPAYFVIIMAHPSVLLVTSIPLLSLFLILKNKDRLIFVLFIFLSIVLSSFWLIPFLKNLGKGAILQYLGGNELLDWNGLLLTNIASSIIPIILIFSFILYIRSNRLKLKREILFFLPVLILSLLFMSRLILLIPFLNKPIPDIYITLFMFYISYYFLKTKINELKFKKIIIGVLYIIVILSTAISLIHTSFISGYTNTEENTLELLPYINGKFLVLNVPSGGSNPANYYTYGAIFYNLSSPYGASSSGAYKEDYKEKIGSIEKSAREGDCLNLVKFSKEVHTEYIISYDKYCDNLLKCRLNKVKQINNVCLLSL